MTPTNKDIIEAFADDFRFLFIKKFRPKLKIRFDGDREIARIAHIKGEKEPTLIFSYYFAESEASSITDIFYCLIICSHEVAHWLNKHTQHEDQGPIDSLAIETWADYFGIRLALTTLSIGRSLNKILDKYRTPALDAARAETLLSSCGYALRMVYDNIYLKGIDSPRYPAPQERAYIISAGVISFFKRGVSRFDLGFSVFIIRNVLLTPFADTEILAADIDWQKIQETSEKIIDIHLSLKGLNAMITPGTKPEFLSLIGTSYLDHDDNAKHREQLQNTVREWGIAI